MVWAYTIIIIIIVIITITIIISSRNGLLFFIYIWTEKEDALEYTLFYNLRRRESKYRRRRNIILLFFSELDIRSKRKTKTSFFSQNVLQLFG